MTLTVSSHVGLRNGELQRQMSQIFEAQAAYVMRSFGLGVCDVRLVLMSMTGQNAQSAGLPCYRKGNNSVLVEDTLSGAVLHIQCERRG